MFVVRVCFIIMVQPKPIAAASLAQVHRATTKDGEVVAVKVQYPRLAAQIRSDMWAMHQLATLLGMIFKVKYRGIQKRGGGKGKRAPCNVYTTLVYCMLLMFVNLEALILCIHCITGL